VGYKATTESEKHWSPCWQQFFDEIYAVCCLRRTNSQIPIPEHSKFISQLRRYIGRGF